MSEEKSKRIRAVASELNVGVHTITEFLKGKSFEVDSNNPNAKISEAQYQLLLKEFSSSAMVKKEASTRSVGKTVSENVVIDAKSLKDKKAADEGLFIPKRQTEPSKPAAPKPVVTSSKPEVAPVPSAEPKAAVPGLKVLGKIDLNAKQPAVAQSVQTPNVKVEVEKPEPVKTEVKEKSEPSKPNQPEVPEISKTAGVDDSQEKPSAKTEILPEKNQVSAEKKENLKPVTAPQLQLFSDTKQEALVESANANNNIPQQEPVKAPVVNREIKSEPEPKISSSETSIKNSDSEISRLDEPNNLKNEGNEVVKSRPDFKPEAEADTENKSVSFKETANERDTRENPAPPISSESSTKSPSGQRQNFNPESNSGNRPAERPQGDRNRQNDSNRPNNGNRPQTDRNQANQGQGRKNIGDSPAGSRPEGNRPDQRLRAPDSARPDGSGNRNRHGQDSAPIQPRVERQQGTVTERPPTETPKNAPVLQPTLNKPIEETVPEPELIEAKANPLKGLTVLGKIELPVDKPRGKSSTGNNQGGVKGNQPGQGGQGNNNQSNLSAEEKNKRKRKRVKVGAVAVGGSQGAVPNQQPNRRENAQQQADKAAADQNRPKVLANPGQSQFGNHGAGGNRQRSNAPQNSNAGARKGAKPEPKGEITDKDIQEKIKATMAKLSGTRGISAGGGRSKYRRDKRSAQAEANLERLDAEQREAKILKVTEFVSASDLASLMDVSVNEVISTCMSLGMFVSINQRLDAESITVIADEFGFDVSFASSESEATAVIEEDDDPADLKSRAPIVTIMGHVDHGKTSLLDYIRKTKVTASEAGGITQHIGAYDVTTSSNKKITFLDTPGHEAFTAMRARGAKVTDVVIIVVAADDNVMPQTKEAINHAQIAGVPIVIAINKIDKPAANPEKIRQELSQMNILVEEWGGKFQSQEISAKTGQGVEDLLEKVLLEAEILDLKANPNRRASGTVIEAMLDKGRGYVATVLVQNGTLEVGDILLAGAHYGRVKAMTDHRGVKMKKAGPAIPVQVLGLAGAPQAGEKFNVMETEKEARDIANKREQIQRELNIRTKKHITLDEIGRRLAIGSFKELNVIIKGDVDGSVEALSDSLLKLSTEEVQVRILSKAVGQISESDVLLASASDAIIIGFQVRPSAGARKLAEQEQIEIRLYSIIYDAINELKDAMEGMLAPKMEEITVGTAEIREIFKITKVGTVAGVMVLEGFIKRNNQIRIVRDGIVVHTGPIETLRRFKDDVNEVKFGYDCGMSFKGFNDIRQGDTIESFEMKETKRTL